MTLATFMEVLETSIADVLCRTLRVPSRPVRRSDLGDLVLPHRKRDRTAKQWVSGAIFCSKRFYMSSVAIFGISSLLCGPAPNLPTLLFFRVVQGLGGGGLAT